MNERIRELAEQAGLKVESLMTNPPKPFQILGSTDQFEKFAELIVQECAGIVNSLEQYEGQGDCSTAEYIKERFGVEE